MLCDCGVSSASSFIFFLYVNTLKQELGGTKTYIQTSIDENSTGDDNKNQIVRFAVSIKITIIPPYFVGIITKGS